MLIDWMTLKICTSKLSQEVLDIFMSKVGRILSINPDGTVEYESFRRDSIRSDSHQLTTSLGGYFKIMGSPARLYPDSLGINDNVFGSCDIVDCFNRMKSRVEEVHGVKLPSIENWQLTTLDITQNYYLKSKAEVERLLNHYRKAESGRYKTATYNDTVYISKGNQVSQGKIYDKGKHLAVDFRKRFPDVMQTIRDDYAFDSTALDLAIDMCSDDEHEKIKNLCIIYDKGQEISKRLIHSANIARFEARYGSRYFRQDLKKIGKGYKAPKAHWYQYTKEDIAQLYDRFWQSRVGKGLDTVDTKKIKDRFVDSAIELGFKEQLGVKAFATWNLIKTVGHINVYSKNNNDSLLTRATFYRHKKIALNAGLTEADFQSGEVVPFTRGVIEMRAVSSWDDVKKLAA